MSTTAQTGFTTGHVGINVTDLERSKRFYQDVFGWKVLEEGGEGGQSFAFLGDESATLVTLWQQGEGRFAATSPGLHHLAFEVAAIEDVRSAEERVRKLEVRLYYDGVVPHAEGDPAGGIFFEDPDGTRLEIYAPSGADTQAAPSGAAPTCGFF